MKIPVTSLSSYMYCSRKLFLEKVLKLAEPPKESLVLGTVRHGFYEEANNMENGIVTSIEKIHGFNEIFDIYKMMYIEALRCSIEINQKRIRSVNLEVSSVFSEMLPKILTEARLRAENVHLFIASNNVFGEELWNILTPKIKSEVRVESESLMLKGIIDQMHIYPEGCVPFELKTGKMPKEGVWPGHRVQIVAYSMLLEEQLNQPVKEGFIRYLDMGIERQVSINPMMKEEVKKITSEVIELMESRELPEFCSNKNKCLSCGLKKDCHNPEKMSESLKITFGNKLAWKNI